MRKKMTVVPIGLALSLGLLAACSKPASQTANETTDAAANAATDAAAVTSDAASSVASGAMAPGGVVSPPQSNEAVNTGGDTGQAGQAPASNSFTEGQARGHIEDAGYTDVSGLTKTADGLWTAKAKKDGKTVDVSLDFKGAVTAK